MTAFSDAGFAVIVTIMVPELKASDQPVFAALWPLWPPAPMLVSCSFFRASVSMPPRREASSSVGRWAEAG
uniref:TMEM175 family protein n=1 Tax=Cupriavidus yeoncheonensis TaxID=1462994 RepID=UPI003F49441D